MGTSQENLFLDIRGYRVKPLAPLMSELLTVKFVIYTDKLCPDRKVKIAEQEMPNTFCNMVYQNEDLE